MTTEEKQLQQITQMTDGILAELKIQIQTAILCGIKMGILQAKEIHDAVYKTKGGQI